MDSVEHVLEEWHRERPDLDPSPIGIFGRIRRISDMARRELAAYLAPFELTPNTFDVLVNLRRSGEPYTKTPTELAESSLLTTGAITTRLDGLEKRQLITRSPHPTDRRVMYVQLAPAGKQLIDEVLDVHLTNENAMLAELTTDERTNVTNALATLEHAIRTALK